jgi:hypothetical protein
MSVRASHQSPARSLWTPGRLLVPLLLSQMKRVGRYGSELVRRILQVRCTGLERAKGLCHIPALTLSQGDIAVLDNIS